MIDIFKDYVLQREELLARIAQELQLDKTRLERMETAYSTVAELLKKDNDFFDDLILPWFQNERLSYLLSSYKLVKLTIS